MMDDDTLKNRMRLFKKCPRREGLCVVCRADRGRNYFERGVATEASEPGFVSVVNVLALWPRRGRVGVIPGNVDVADLTRNQREKQILDWHEALNPFS